MINSFLGSFTEEVMVIEKDIVEGWLKFETSDSSKKFNSRALSDRGVIWEQSGINF